MIKTAFSWACTLTVLVMVLAFGVCLALGYSWQSASSVAWDLNLVWIPVFAGVLFLGRLGRIADTKEVEA